MGARGCPGSGSKAAILGQPRNLELKAHMSWQPKVCREWQAVQGQGRRVLRSSTPRTRAPVSEQGALQIERKYCTAGYVSLGSTLEEGSL